jgi:hypothetical protein
MSSVSPLYRGGGGRRIDTNAAPPILYQIDFTAVSAGKRVASTKRRMRWYEEKKNRIDFVHCMFALPS